MMKPQSTGYSSSSCSFGVETHRDVKCSRRCMPFSMFCSPYLWLVLWMSRQMELRKKWWNTAYSPSIWNSNLNTDDRPCSSNEQLQNNSQNGIIVVYMLPVQHPILPSSDQKLEDHLIKLATYSRHGKSITSSANRCVNLNTVSAVDLAFMHAVSLQSV